MAQGSETPRLDTFAKLLCEHARVRPTRPAMRHKDLGIWRTWTWSEMAETIRAYAAGLRQLGLERGATIAVIGENRPAMYWTILAAQWLGAIPVPVYADAVADEMAYVLAHADVGFAVVQDQEQVDKLITIQDKIPNLKVVLYDEPRGLRDYDHSQLHALDDIIEKGRTQLAADPAAAAAIDAERDRGTADDISIILYTSGTTGRSKGVLFSAGRSIAAARDTVEFDKLTDRDEVLAYLPLAWVGDHYLNYAHAMVAGFCVACPESRETAEADLQEIGPTFYFAPPRIFEALLTRITIRMEDAGSLKRRMFNHFIGVARRWGEKILNGEQVPFGARINYALGNLLVYAPLKNVLGFSRIRVAYTAGEAIGPDLFSFYRSLGLNLKQLYGQTEAFLYVTSQLDGHIRAGTVGPATPNVDIRIADDGEVLYRSPGQFIGYYKDDEKTVETVTTDGYVKTGDAGFFDNEGHLNIIDRAKDVGKLRSGALFAPKYIENKLKFYPNIKEAVAFGQGQEFVTCMLNIDLTAVGNWAERNNIAYASYQELAQRPEVYSMFAGHVAEVNRALAAEPRMAAAQVRRFLILHKELDADDGEMTRTQKVRRGFIAERYKPLVDALYNGSDAADISTEVTFEDGRKGVISARVRIADAEVRDVQKLDAAA
ncbi:long-chain fatty acid--CoA ligase [Mesorhizobium sp. Root552]|uniref:AMP-dependent synthetase/ligase n=1 Tax=Mesorhizobium sp. Root552 TaxID=1736555 RepID=UPI0006FFB7CD|nr:AMP-binding protein [Mesorhizobium sp. Root552]KQZ31676.1 long-chain fatty acid--CoA ligase [Mesorhizobium sp. Root552]